MSEILEYVVFGQVVDEDGRELEYYWLRDTSLESGLLSLHASMDFVRDLRPEYSMSISVRRVRRNDVEKTVHDLIASRRFAMLTR